MDMKTLFIRKRMQKAKMLRLARSEKKKEQSRQVTTIMAGGGINYEYWCEQERAKGNRVELHKGHARVFA